MKKEVRALIKEMGYTADQMQAFWDELKEVNSKVKMLSNNGVNWFDMAPSVIRTLPEEKEKTLKRLAEQKEKEQKEKEEAERKQQEKEYFEQHFEEIMLNRIDNGEAIEEKYLEELVDGFEIETIKGDIGRWTMHMTTIIQLGDRTFAINWERGLTEMQENSYMDQPYEVEKVAQEKVVVVTEWHRLTKRNKKNKEK